MTAIERISTQGALEIKLDISAPAGLINRDTLIDGFRAIAPSGIRHTLQLARTEPAAGNSPYFSAWVLFDLTSSPDWEVGVHKLVALTTIKTVAGVSLPEELELRTVRLRLVNAERPSVEVRSLDPILDAATQYQFKVDFVDVVGVDATTITANNVILRRELPLDKAISKQPERLIGTEILEGGRKVTATYEIDHDFSDGTYFIDALSGAVKDTGGLGNLHEVAGTIGVATTDVGEEPGTLTTFVGISALPTGWTQAGEETIEFLSEGVLLPKPGEHNFAGSWLRSPMVVLEDEADIQMDFMGAAYDSQLGSAGDNSLLRVVNQEGFHGDQLLWRDDGSPVRKKMRIRWQVDKDTLTTTFYHDLGRGYVINEQIVEDMPSHLPKETHVYLDAIREDLLITAFRS